MAEPIYKARAGAVSGAVWINEHPQHGKSHSATITKSFKDTKSGEWKETNSFYKKDLDDLVFVTRRLSDYMRDNPLKKDGGD